MNEEDFVALETALQNAASKVARTTKVILRLSLWRHEVLDNRREVVGSQYEVEWLIPLFGVSTLEKEIVHEPEFKKYLEANLAIVIDGRIHLKLVTDVEYGGPNKPVTPLQDGVGLPNKTSRELLEIRDLNCENSWNVKLEFTPGNTKYLKKVSLVHDSEKHPQITEYLHEVTKRLMILSMRSAYAAKK